MKTISSKNTWYLIFGLIFVIFITIFSYRFIFRRTTAKVNSVLSNGTTTARPSLVGQTTTKSNLNYISVATTSTAVTTTTTTKTTPVTTTTQVATPASDLKLITNPSGATYLTTTKVDGSTDSASTRSAWARRAAGQSELIVLPLGFASDLGEYINRILRFVLMIAVLLVFSQLVIGGVEWITSGGDKAKVDGARNKIVAAVVGLIIVASSFAILQLVLNFLGFKSINELLQML